MAGVCSQQDGICESGRRYTPFAGGLANECVAPEHEMAGSSTGHEPDGPDTTIPLPGSTGADDEGDAGDTAGDDLPPQAETTGGTFDFEFVDQNAADFAEGTMAGVRFDDGLRLGNEGTQGLYTSQVFDAGEPVYWNSLRWTPRAPYAKPLPDGAATETGYTTGAADMQDNVLLLHFEDASSFSPGEFVHDGSGRDHAVQLLGATSAATTPSGAAGRALALSPSNYVEIETGSNDDFQFAEGDFTWSMWARTNASCAQAGGGSSSNQVFMGVDADVESGGAHMWLGCFNPADGACGQTSGLGRLGGTFTADQGDGLGQFCAGPELVDGQWHHLAVVKLGHQPATLSVLFDGALIQTSLVDYALPLSFDPAEPLRLGRLGDGYRATADIDEVAVFRRALTMDEIEDLYLRGALQLEFQVRACDSPTCADTDFSGPDEDPDATYRDGPDGTVAGLESRYGRYFQYSARLSRPSATLPRGVVLDAVRVTATAE